MGMLEAAEPLLLEFIIRELRYARAAHENQMKRDPSFTDKTYARTLRRIRQIDDLVDAMQARIDAS